MIQVCLLFKKCFVSKKIKCSDNLCHLEEFFTSEGVLLRELTKWHAAHFFQNGVDAELNQIIDSVKQQLQVLFGKNKMNDRLGKTLP